MGTLKDLIPDSDDDNVDESISVLREENLTLPTREDLEHYPEMLKDAVSKIGTQIMQLILVPRLMLWVRRLRKEKAQPTAVSGLTLDIMKQQPLYSSWPDNLLYEVMNKFKPVYYDVGEFVVHEGEPSRGMMFLLAGRLDCLKRKSKRREKPVYITLTHFSPICLIGDYSAFSQEPRAASIKATDPSVLAFLSNVDFKNVISKLDPIIFEKSISGIVQKKSQGVKLLLHPPSTISDEQLMQNILFKDVSSQVLEFLRTKCSQHTVGNKVVLFQGGVVPTEIIFLSHGHCLVSECLNDEDETNIVLSEITAPQWIGTSSMVKQQPMPHQMKTCAKCCFWKLRLVDFKSLRYSCPDTWRQLQVIELREETFTTGYEESQLHDLVASVPIIKQCFASEIEVFQSSKATLEEQVIVLKIQPFISLAVKFKLRLYRPLQTITSKSEICNRIIIPLSGKLTIVTSGIDREWYIGEPAGFTSVLPHRWAHSSFAATTVQCLELSSSLYVTHMKEQGKYREAAKLSKYLINPIACSDSQYDRSQIVVEHLRTPHMYPVSSSTSYSCTEWGTIDFMWKGIPSKKHREKIARRAKMVQNRDQAAGNVSELQDRLNAVPRIEKEKKKSAVFEVPITPLSPDKRGMTSINVISAFTNATLSAESSYDVPLSIPSYVDRSPPEESLHPKPPPKPFNIHKRLYPNYLQHPPLRTLLGKVRRPRSAAMAACLESTPKYIASPIPHSEPCPPPPSSTFSDSKKGLDVEWGF